MSFPKVSVIMPAHNVAGYIRHSLDSALADTLAIEVIVVDDASTDDTVAIVREYCTADNRVALIALESNGGPGRARNEGIKKATGDFIFFLDADDMLMPGALSKLYARALLDDAEIVCLGYVRQFGFREIDYSRKVIPQIDENKDQLLSDVLLLRHNIMTAPWAYFYSRELVNRCALWFPEGVFFEDVYFVVTAFYYATRVSAIHDALYVYRVRKQSITHDLFISKKKILDYYSSNANIKSFLLEKGVFPKFTQEYGIRFLSYSLYLSHLDYFRMPRHKVDMELQEFMSSARKNKDFSTRNLWSIKRLVGQLGEDEHRIKNFYQYVFRVMLLVKYCYPLFHATMTINRRWNNLRSKK